MTFHSHHRGAFQFVTRYTGSEGLTIAILCIVLFFILILGSFAFISPHVDHFGRCMNATVHQRTDWTPAQVYEFCSSQHAPPLLPAPGSVN